jgi:hypothetical protein
VLDEDGKEHDRRRPSILQRGKRAMQSLPTVISLSGTLGVVGGLAGFDYCGEVHLLQDCK